MKLAHAAGRLAAALLLACAQAAHAQNADWMGQIVHGGTYLSELTIPGTHDSAATKDPVIAGVTYSGTARAQTTSITTQLLHGVRFLDLRFRQDGTANGLQPAHGPTLQPGTARSIFQEIADFLALHPHEMVIVSIKHETDPLGSDISAAEFVRRMNLLYADPTFHAMFSWTTSVPTYTYGNSTTAAMPGRIANRVILVRRYPGADRAPYGIDASSGWPDNTTGNVGAWLRVEDRYDFRCGSAVDSGCFNTAVSTKLNTVYDVIRTALQDEGGWVGRYTWAGDRRLRLQYASATLFATTQGVIPYAGAIPYFSDRINPVLEERAGVEHGRAGVVVLDREDAGVVGALVHMNRLRPFEHGVGGNVLVDPATRSVSYRMPSGQVVALGGVAVGSGTAIGGANASQMSVFVVGTDRALYTSWQRSAGSTSFVPFTYLAGRLSSNPVAVRLCSGVMQIFARGTDGTLHTIWQNAPGSGWSDWASLGGDLRSRVTVSASGCNVTVSGIGGDGAAWAITRSGATGAWGGWFRL